jgi:hypothetical protein
MTIERILDEIGLTGCEYRTDEEDVGYTTYTVEAPRHLMRDAQRKLWASKGIRNASIHIDQITPELVQAEPGQVVRIYCDREPEDDKSPVGVVTSKQVIDGEVVYGCSYIQVAIGNSFVSDLYSFHLTTENYGGYHAGFLKIIPPEELSAIMVSMIEEGHKKSIERANSMKETALKNLGNFVKMFEKGTVREVTRWTLSDDDTHYGVSVQLPKM